MSFTDTLSRESDERTIIFAIVIVHSLSIYFKMYPIETECYFKGYSRRLNDELDPTNKIGFSDGYLLKLSYRPVYAVHLFVKSNCRS